MSFSEKLRAAKLLSQAKEARTPSAQDKAEAKDIAGTLSSKYAIAIQAMKRLPRVPQTKELHEGYTRYFSTARELFLDFAKSENLVGPKRQALLSRKEALEALDRANKDLDERLRKQYGVEAFRS